MLLYGWLRLQRYLVTSTSEITGRRTQVSFAKILSPHQLDSFVSGNLIFVPTTVDGNTMLERTGPVGCVFEETVSC